MMALTNGSETYPFFTSSHLNLSGKTIFITGASRGIGLAIAKRCAKDGCNIVIAAKTDVPHPKLPGTIHTAAKEIESMNPNTVALPVVCDIRHEELVAKAVLKAVNAFGGIDIVINNASAISVTDTESTTMKKYDLMNAVNARGTFLVTKCCLAYLKKSANNNNNPHILTMSPPLHTINKQHFSGKIAYWTAKTGMSLCTLGWSQELRKWNIAANSLWPRTAIATSAIKYVLGGDALMKRSRTPKVHADAAYLILTQNSETFNGNYVYDEDILRQSGVTDFKKYRADQSMREKDIIRIGQDTSWSMDHKQHKTSKL